MRFSEVVDNPESLKEFIDMNKIKQDQILGVVIIWDEDIDNGR